MAVRKIEYIVTAVGLNPATIQQGGVQGEHRATEVVFNLDKLYTELENMKTDGKRLIFRIDGYDGEGGIHRSDTSELENKEIHYFLEERLTRQGGSVKIVLVISLVLNDETEMELYSFPAVIQLRNLPDGKTIDSKNYESISILAEVAKASAEIAESSMMVAVDAKEKTVSAKAALENGTEWVFDGGNASDEISIDFVVDDAMSDTSKNAVMNKIVKAYIDQTVKMAIDKAKQEAKLEAHPIGSLYFSDNDTDPAELFGGAWVRVEDRFILTAGSTYSAGSTGGKAEVKLTIKQMPSHHHTTIVGTGSGEMNYNPKTLPQGVDPSLSITGSTGGDQPHENMPPYEVYYCWKRIKE